MYDGDMMIGAFQLGSASIGLLIAAGMVIQWLRHPWKRGR